MEVFARSADKVVSAKDGIIIVVNLHKEHYQKVFVGLGHRVILPM